MALGLFILDFHWVWTLPGLIVTAVGGALALEGALYCIYPGRRNRSRPYRRKQWLAIPLGGPFGLLLGLIVRPSNPFKVEGHAA